MGAGGGGATTLRGPGGREIDVEKAARGVARLIKGAQEDPAEFMAFIVRSEATRERVRVAAHQRVMFAFIDHPPHVFSNLIAAVGHTKTTMLTSYGLYCLSRDTNLRGAVYSKTQKIAKKPLKVMRQVIEGEPRVRAVNERMRRGGRVGDEWGDLAFTVDRDIGIKDPSFQAAGLDTGIGSVRVDLIICDDLEDRENSNTPDQRNTVIDQFDSMISPRLSAKGRLVVANSPFHQDDLVNVAKKRMPTLEMSAYGDIRVYNADPDWYWEDLLVKVRPDERQKNGRTTMHFRLRVHEPDPKMVVSLWPEVWPIEKLERTRIEQYPHAPGTFSRLYKCDVFDDESALCKREFIERCMKLAVLEAATHNDPTLVRLQHEYRGSDPTFTGVDPAVSQKDAADYTAMFTFRVRLSDGVCVILDVDMGHWDAQKIVQKAKEKHDRYQSAIAVENNGAFQYIVQLLQDAVKYVPVEGLTTNASSKENPEYGVVEVFYEMANGMWRIPNSEGVLDSRLQVFAEACQGYSPTKHPHDLLMACHIGRRLAHNWGLIGRRGNPLRPSPAFPPPTLPVPPAPASPPAAPTSEVRPMARSAFDRRKH